MNQLEIESNLYARIQRPFIKALYRSPDNEVYSGWQFMPNDHDEASSIVRREWKYWHQSNIRIFVGNVVDQIKNQASYSPVYVFPGMPVHTVALVSNVGEYLTSIFGSYPSKYISDRMKEINDRCAFEILEAQYYCLVGRFIKKPKLKIDIIEIMRVLSNLCPEATTDDDFESEIKGNGVFELWWD